MNSYQKFYYCEICDTPSQQKSHNDAHIKSNSHIQKCNIFKCNVLEKIDILSLINQYNVMLNKPIQAIYDEIISNKSQQKLTKEEIVVKQEQNKKIIDDNKIEIGLSHELTQFTAGKTDQTLNQIIERYMLNMEGMEEHLIEVIITNNSLPETEQWKVRTKNKFGGYQDISVDILSSSKESDFNNINQFISKIITAKNKSELPNILIVCFHKKRVLDNLFQLFETFCGGNYVLNFTKLKFYLNFDEPDANLGITSRFLSRYRVYEHIIRGILFITATPYEDFWEMLKQHGITQLLNLQSLNNMSDISYIEYLNNYRAIDDHEFRSFNDNTNNPLEYIRKVYEGRKYQILNDEGDIVNEIDYIDKSKPYIIFAPGHIYTEVLGVGSHEEIVDYFTSKGDNVFLSNGKFKGFVYPSGARELLTDFNKNNNITGELRDSLRKWRELNPSSNLVITGYWTIERGITFNTDGFNFDYAIVSTYHSLKLNKLLQLIGRTTGNKLYVNKMVIICPEIIFKTIKTTVENTIALRKLNPQNYNKTDFSSKNSSIPVMIEFIDNEYYEKIIASITNKRNYKVSLHNLLEAAFKENKIKITDRNNLHKFTFEKKLKGVKMYMKERIDSNNNVTEDKIEVRRFKEFKSAFDTYKGTSQTCNEGEYCIDIAKDDYINGDFINKKNIAWVTFKY